MSAKKEYSIVINGLTKSIKDVTSLDAALNSLDQTAKAATANNAAATKVATAKVKGLTDEEKAAKRLADTQRRLVEVGSEANRAQIEATKALRDKTREVTREVALNGLAEGSIAALGMQLTDLRNSYERLSEAERQNIDIGGAQLAQIQALDKQYKGLRESTGNFRDSVGNYEKALNGLNDLDKGLGQVGGTVNGLTTAFGENSQIMGLFGGLTETTTEAQAELAKIIALVTIAMQIANVVNKEGTVATIAKTAADKIATIQLRAKAIAEALATRSTIAATAAQAVFNAVAAANPYVLLALALVGVVAALVAFTNDTDDAAEAQKKLNEQQNIWLDYLDSEVSRLKLVSDARIAGLERQLRLMDAQKDKFEESRKLENQILREKQLQNARTMGFYQNEIQALEENRTKLQTYYDLLRQLQLAEARGDSKLFLDIDLNGKAEKVNVKEAIETVQNKVNTLNRSVEIAVRLKTEEADLRAQNDILAAQRAQEDKERAKQAAQAAKQAKEEAKRKADEARKNAQERAALEVEAQRAAEDLKLKLAGQTYETQRQLIILDFKRQIEDLKIRLANEKNLTTKAREDINAQIINLDKVKDQQLAELSKERHAKELETTRQLEDQKTALIVGLTDRRRAEINNVYDRQIEDVKLRLATEKDLTEVQQQALNEMIIGYDKQRAAELDALTVENANRRASLDLQVTEQALKDATNKIGEVVRSNKVTGIIDVEATKANLVAVNTAYDQYIQGLVLFQAELKEAHEKTIAGLKEGSIEYDEEVQRYAAANADASQKIKETQKAQTENTKTATQLQISYYQSLFNAISGYADVAAQAVTMVTDTLNMGLEAAVESLNEQLEVVNEYYEKAKEKREQYAAEVEDVESRLQDATGGTADALKEQLQSTMRLRDEAAREELRLQREKEKREAEIAKKEKQMRRNELIGKIAMGIANTAQAITQALTLAWPLNLVMAALVGGLGAVQTGLMARQLTKLEKGGEIKGPSHANGGVRVNGTDIEVEGGEFVTNKTSYAANKELVQFINDSPQRLSATDLVGMVPGFDNVPVSVTDAPSASEDRVVDAIENIQFNPVVSVVDIIDVSNDVTTVKDLADF